MYEQGDNRSRYLTTWYIFILFHKNEGPNGPLIGRLVSGLYKRANARLIGRLVSGLYNRANALLIGRLVSELYKRANALLIERLVSMNILRGLTPSL